MISASPSRRPLPALLAGLLTGLIGAGSLAPFVAPACAAGTVTPATGGGAISADTAASTNWTTLTGPSIAVTLQAGDTPDIPIGSITLTAPSGFAFNPSSTPTIGAGNSDLVGSCAAPMNATVTCTISAPTAAAGTVTFSGIAVQPTARTPLASGTITFGGTAGAGLTGVAGTLVEVAGTPAKLAFSAQPGGGAAWATWATQPVVKVQDAAGSTASITLKLNANQLICGVNPLPAVAGTAAFSGCQFNTVGTGYALVASVASTPGLGTATSTTFAILAGQNVLVFAIQPGGGPAGKAFANQPVVTVKDPDGKLVTSTALITLSIGTNPGNPRGTLTCTGGLSKLAVAGLATFSGCAIDKTGTGYAIGATVTGLTIAKSAAISVAAGAAAKVGFTIDPVGAAGGAALSKQPIVAVQDTAGNTVTTNTGTVTLALSAGTGTAGAILTCTGGLSKAAAAGVATFAGCAIDKAGTGYKLTAGDRVDRRDVGGTRHQPGPGQTARLQDAAGRGPRRAGLPQPAGRRGPGRGGATVAAGTATVTLAITTGTGTAGAALGCTIDRAGTGYTLSATSGGLTLGVSNPLNVSALVAVMTVTPAAASIRYGRAATLGVTFSFGGANATVHLQESMDGKTWALVSPVTTDAAGSATFTCLIATTRWFRVTYPGDRELLPGTSKAVNVAVQYSTILRPTNLGKTKTVSHGKAITFTATVRPTVASTPRTRVTFEIYKFVGGKWAFVTRRVVATNALGTARLKWTFAKTGTWSVRARAAGTTQNSTGPWTARETYRVT